MKPPEQMDNSRISISVLNKSDAQGRQFHVKATHKKTGEVVSLSGKDKGDTIAEAKKKVMALVDAKKYGQPTEEQPKTEEPKPKTKAKGKKKQ